MLLDGLHAIESIATFGYELQMGVFAKIFLNDASCEGFVVYDNDLAHDFSLMVQFFVSAVGSVQPAAESLPAL